MEQVGLKVVGNVIGLDVSGTRRLENFAHGVHAKVGVTIGADVSGEGNVISGNRLSGVFLDGGGGGSLVLNNRIGTDTTGEAADGVDGSDLGNGTNGILARSSIVTTFSGNVISGNGADGLRLENDFVAPSTGQLPAPCRWSPDLPICQTPDPCSDSSVIRGNKIGTDKDGMSPIPNAGAGVVLSSSAGAKLGVAEAGGGNIIAGNGSTGVLISGPESQCSDVHNNRIGVAFDGAALPNGGTGILFNLGAHSNAVGGDLTGESNIIAHNNGDGVQVDGVTAIRNFIWANSIHSNSGKGIRNTNGGNLEPLPPTITSAGSSGVSGTACPGCGVAIYSDASDEGRVFHVALLANEFGAWSLAAPMAGPNITATTILVGDGTLGSTSEFSAPFSLDTDLDGVSSEVEDAAPNNGDGNSDGIPDSTQGDVASLPNAADGSGSGGSMVSQSLRLAAAPAASSSYMTLVSSPGTMLQGVQAIGNPAPGSAPPSVDFPIGFLDFRVAGLTPGGSTTVSVIDHSSAPIQTYFKFGSFNEGPANPDWYEFSYDGQTGAEISGSVVTLHFVDGARGDDDLTQNGVVHDPGAPAIRLDTATPTITPTHTSTPTPPATATSTASPTPTSTPDPAAKRFYLCGSSSLCTPANQPGMVINLGSGGSWSWSVPLALVGDIAGTRYAFQIYVGSLDPVLSTTMRADILIGGEVVASSTFTAGSHPPSYSSISRFINDGIDPSATGSTTVALRVTHLSGGNPSIIWGGFPPDQSTRNAHIEIPGEGPAPVTSTSTPSSTPTQTPTPAGTATATATGTPTAASTATSTPTRTSTNTPTLTATSTATSTPTRTSTNTPTLTPTGTATPTPTRTSTNTPTLTATSTATPTPTRTSTHTPTLTATSTATPTSTPSPAFTNTPIPTATPSPIATHSPTATPTTTQTASPSPTATPSPAVPSFTPAATATNTAVPTVAADTPIPTATSTSEPTATATPVPSETTAATSTSTATATLTPSPTERATATTEPSATPTQTSVASPSATLTPSATQTSTNTPVPSVTPTPTPVHTATATRTAVPTATNTRPPEPSRTPLTTRTPERSRTVSPTATPTPTPAPTGHRCADVSGDGRVTLRDLLLIAQRLGSKDGGKHDNAKFDLNRDRLINAVDIAIAAAQIGRRCRG